MRSGQARFSRAFDDSFAGAAVGDQICDGEKRQPMPLGERREGRAAHHGAVSVDNLTEHPRGSRSREPREIDRSLGVTGTFQDTTVAGPQREDVAGPQKVVGEAHGLASPRIVAARSAAEMPVVVPSFKSTETVNAVP